MIYIPVTKPDQMISTKEYTLKTLMILCGAICVALSTVPVWLCLFWQDAPEVVLSPVFGGMAVTGFLACYFRSKIDNSPA